MGKEYEARFFNYKKSEIIKILKSLGAKKLHPKISMERENYDLINDPRGYGRVRQEHKCVTMTLKLKTHPKYPEEYEVTIKEPFEIGREFMRKMPGLRGGRFQETFREKWVDVPGCHEVCFDSWPGLPDFVEVDCNSLRGLKKITKILGLNMNEAYFSSVDETYQKIYGIPTKNFNQSPFITFKNIKKELGRYVTKEHELFNKIAKKHQQLKRK
tara:strand:+ start:42 stop:683 length:642 start_codon:yes stop_codon:yes gene_type:complete